MMHFLAIDPGKTTGWASFTKEGDLIATGKIRGHDEFLDWLEEQEAKEIILERYRNRVGGKSTAINAWSENETSQLIGAIKRVARKSGIKVHEQNASDGLAFGLRFLGVYGTYYRGGKRIKHVPDDISALAHGTYYMRKNVKK